MNNKLKLKKVVSLKKSIIKPKLQLQNSSIVQTKKLKKQNKNFNDKNKSFFSFLVKVDAFIGDTYLKNHYTHNPHIFAFRNNYAIYEHTSSYLGLKSALQFLNKQKVENLLFVGSPTNTGAKCKEIFAFYNVRFFPSQSWIPGYISKNSKAIKNVLIIYDIFLNSGAKSEGFHCKLPIVGFVNKYGNNNGLDYPVLLNFDNCGFFLLRFMEVFFFL